MVAEEPIKHGEQVWNTYVDVPNADLLRIYGHVNIIPLDQGGSFPYGIPQTLEILADLVYDVCLPDTGEEQRTCKIEACLTVDEPEEWDPPLIHRTTHFVR